MIKKVSVQKNIDSMALMFQEWKKALTDEDKRVLYEYSKFFYEEVNDFLRNDNLNNDFGSSPDDFRLKEYIDKIDDVLNKFTLPEEILVYRNEHHNVSIEEMHDFIRGVDRIEYKNFISTTFTRRAAEQFLSNLKKHYADEALLCIEGKVQKGIPCGYLDKDISAMLGEEDEILISRNVSFKIDEELTDVSFENRTINIYGQFEKG